jgi:CHAD domain-containing protein
MLPDSLASDATVWNWLASSEVHVDTAHRSLADSQRLANKHFTSARDSMLRADVGKSKKISAKHLAPVYDQGRESVRVALTVGSEDSFHDLRKAVKSHLYQCRFMKSAFAETMTPRIELTERVGDLLGEAQDIAVLRSRCRIAPATIDKQELDSFLSLCEQAAMGRRADALTKACRMYFLTTPEFVKQLKSD